MSSESTDESSPAQSMPRDDRQTVADCRSGVKLLCPVRIAYPHLRPETKTCDNHCNDIRRVKEHLNKHHHCVCPGQPEPCQNPLHLESKKLKQLRAVRHLPGETPGEQWGRIFKTLHPHRNDIPAPYVPSASDLKAIARAPPPGFIASLAEILQSVTHESIDEGRLLLAVPHFIDLVCRTGAYPDSQSSAPRRSSNNGDSAAHTSRQGSAVAEHQEPTNDVPDWGEILNLAQFAP